jgi:hypothetical protein
VSAGRRCTPARQRGKPRGSPVGGLTDEYAGRAGGPRRSGASGDPAADPQTGTGPQTGTEPRDSGGAAVPELVVRVAATVVATWAGLLLAVLGVFLTPYRVGGALVPVSWVIAVGGNAALIWFGWAMTRHRLLAMLPGAGWIAVALIASSATGEGDIPLAGNSWVALVFLIIGSMTVAVAGYRLILRGPADADRADPRPPRG